MFSGIVEATAKVVAIEREDTNLRFTFAAPFASELTIDQSVAHNGVCLTVVSLDGDRYSVVAIEETLRRSNLGLLKVGDKVNIERSMRLDGRLDGHIVQGHVDTTAVCESVVEADGSHVFRFRYDIPAEMARKGYVTVEKGSVTVNGVSLTVCDSERDSFSVAIIPYTFDNTNFHDIREGSTVNIEFDIIGKYLSRMMEFVK